MRIAARFLAGAAFASSLILAAAIAHPHVDRSLVSLNASATK